MLNPPFESTPPAHSQIVKLVPGAYFHDAWAIRAADSSLDALSQFLRVTRTTPAWIDRLMRLRNHIVSRLGLKDLGSLSQIDPLKPAADYRPGDRVGIFTLISASRTEVLLGDRDKHLDVVVSLHQQPAADDGAATVTVTTVVKVHNLLGRLYMLPVRPAHRIITQAMVRAVGRSARRPAGQGAGA